MCFLNYEQVEKMNISLAADGIMKDLKLSASVFALASSLYFVPYGLLPVPCSLLAKRAGVRIGLASMCLAFGLVAMSTAGVQNAASLMAMRLALGATEAGVWPFVSYIISLFFGTYYYTNSYCRCLVSSYDRETSTVTDMTPFSAYAYWTIRP